MKIEKLYFILLLMTTTQGFPQEGKNEQEEENLLYIGTYTRKEGHVDGKAEGIYSVYQNPENGSLRFGGTVAEVTNPSYVKVSPDGKFLYAVSELVNNEAAAGLVFSYRINDNDSLEEIGKISTEGFAPCHIAIDDSGNFVFVSNYIGGVVMVYEKGENGNLKQKERLDIGIPEESHTHSVIISLDNTHFYVADLGMDRIWIFDFDASTGKIKPHPKMPFLDIEEGAGPRHFAFSKNGNFLYSANELGNSVGAYTVNRDGSLEQIQSLPAVPRSFSGKNSPADIHLHPSGKYLYTSNRGHNSISSFKVDENSGKLTFLEAVSSGGKTPRNFTIAPEGEFMYVANQDSGNISIYKIDPENGKLQQHLEPFEIKTPVCIEFY